MKHFTLKSLATSISLMMASMGTAYASDIEIYKVPDQTQTTILMMIDISGSMTYCDGVAGFVEGSGSSQNYRLNGPNNTTSSINKTSKLGITYDMPYCVVNGQNYYSRSARLRDAIINLMDSDQLGPDIHLAIGTFHNGRGGRIAMEAKPLTTQHKKDIQTFIANQGFGGGTPTAAAYVEAAAYMLGKSTNLTGVITTGSTQPPKEVYIESNGTSGNRQWKKCIQWDSGTGNCTGFTSHASMVYENDPTGKNTSIFGGKTYQNLPFRNYNVAQCRSSSQQSKTCLTILPKELFVPHPTNSNLWSECTAWHDDRPNSCKSYFKDYDINAHRPPDALGRHPWYVDKNKNIDTLTDRFSPYSEYIEVSCTSSSFSAFGNGKCLVSKDSQSITPTFDFTKWASTYSGFTSSVQESKDKNSVQEQYKSPLPKTLSECNGQAIYYLMDGNADGTEPTQFVIDKLLGQNFNFPTNHNIFTGSNYLADRGNNLAQVGELSKRLREANQNPSGASIKTAIVGFGTVFKEASDNKVNLQSPDGKMRTYYNCSVITDERIKNVCNWGEKRHASLPNVGGYGEGGFFHATNAQDIVDSFLQVTNDTKITFNPIVTGTPTIPVDSLNRQNYLSDAYYNFFTPRPETLNQLWVGSLNKYTVLDGRLVNQNRQALFDNGFVTQNSQALWGSGTTDHLSLQKAGNGEFQRTIYTNRLANSQNAANTNSNSLRKITVSSFNNGGFLSQDPDKNYILNLLGYNIAKDAQNINVSTLQAPELRQIGATIHSKPILLTQEGKLVYNYDNGTLSAINRKDYLLLGSTQGLLHIVDAITGEEKFSFLPDEIVKNQKDAFLHKDSTTGGAANLFYGIDGQWTNLTQYVSKNDGTLTVNQSDITYLKNADPNTPVHLRGLQWVYGGLRMGGSSYYGLDLTDIDNPTFKFHIDPKNRKIYSSLQSNTSNTPTNARELFSQAVVNGGTRAWQQCTAWATDGISCLRNDGGQENVWENDPNGTSGATGRRPFINYTVQNCRSIPNQTCLVSRTDAGTNSYPEIGFMGQSWSKPTIGYVNWHKADGSGSERRPVIFVGGGYDLGYETSNYQQSNKIGAGVYMFDADTGALLWWASANTVSSPTTGVIKHSAVGDDTSSLQYSVVSRINAIDRNNDGLVDHLYFGDLGGQGFRIDLDNNANSNANFSKRVVRILNEHRANGLSPRFYEAPSVSIHEENGNTIAAVAFSSGDRSSPLAGARTDVLGNAITQNSQTANDGVFVVYDQDVVRQNLFALAMTNLHTRAISSKTLANANFVDGVPVTNNTLGWKLIYNQNLVEVRNGVNEAYEAGDVKGFGEPYVITSLLLIDTYNRKGVGIGGQCGGGIIGSSQTYQFCLPTGQCTQDKHGYTVNQPNEFTHSNESVGAIGSTLGGKEGKGFSIVSTHGHSDSPTIPLKPEDIQGEITPTLRQLRWYESRLGG